MIEVLALAGAVTKIAGAVSSAVKAGSDVADLLPHFGKFGSAMLDLEASVLVRQKSATGKESLMRGKD